MTRYDAILTWTTRSPARDAQGCRSSVGLRQTLRELINECALVQVIPGLALRPLYLKSEKAK